MNTVLRDLSITWMLIHCCVLFMLLYESRYTKRKTNIITAVFMIPIVVVNVPNVNLFGIETAGKLIVFCCVLPSLIFFFIMAKNRDTRFLFTFCVCDTIVLEVLFATNLLDTALDFGNYVVMFVSRLVIMPLLELLIVKYLRKPYHLIQRQMKKGWGIFSLMAALFYVSLLLFTYYPTIILDRPEYFPYLILMMILVPVMYMTVFKVLWTQIKLFESAQENRELDVQIKMAEERLLRGRENESNIKILRHDTKHQMLLLNDYIKNKSFDKVEKYIESLVENIDRYALKSYCNNYCANVVLSYYSVVADKKGIDFECDINLPEALNISETDLAVVLSNGLENAINAQSDCGSKIIFIKGFTEEDKIWLEIKNPLTGAVQFDGKMPLSKQENHGYGTRSMAAIVEKYEGIYSFAVEDGEFVFRCCM